MTSVEEIEKKGLPYGCDYAKTGRSGCKEKDCPNKEIEKDELRMSARVKSNFSEGLQDVWFHFDCFWKRARRGITEASIRNFEHLKWEDQERIRSRIQRKDDMADDPKSWQPKAEYAKSGRASCMECKEKMANKELRIEFKSGFWHPQCLADKRLYIKPAEEITDFDDLEEDDQALLRELFTGPNEDDLKKVSAGEDDEMTLSDLKRIKEEETDEAKKRELDELEERKEALKAQTDLIWEAKDDIMETLKNAPGPKTQKAKKEFVEDLLNENGGNPFEKGTLDDHVQLLADILVFGAFGPCPECNNANFYYSADRRVYQCASGCEYFDRKVHRIPFKTISGAKGLSKYEKKILLPAGRVFSKSVEEHVGEDKLVSLEPKPEKKAAASRKRKSKKDEPEGIMKENGYSVDAYFSLGDDFHVYVDEDGDPYQFLLHKVDEKNGKIKFYKMQLLENDTEEEYRVFRRYGVVLTGVTKDLSKIHDDFASALKDFEKIFREKAGFPWAQRHVEQKKRAAKDYALVEWKSDLSGTYGRASYDQGDDEDSPIKKAKIEEDSEEEIKKEKMIKKEVKTEPKSKEPAKKAVKKEPKKAIKKEAYIESDSE